MNKISLFEETETLSMSNIIKNTDIILGTSTEIDRLFYVARGILSSKRRMTLLLFESLSKLKVNHGY